MPKKIRMPSLEDIKSAYAASGSKAATEYAKGIDAATGVVDAMASDSAEALWASQLSAAIAAKKRQAKIREKVTDSSWKADAKTKGAPVLATRITLAKEDMGKGYSPVHSALSGLELPDKTADPYANIDNISKLVVKTMRKAVGKE
jgi:hypothetical protein